MIDKPFVDRIEELRFQTYSHLTDLQRNLIDFERNNDFGNEIESSKIDRLLN